MNEIRTAHVDTNENPADIATKIIPSGTKRDHLVSLVLWDIADAHCARIADCLLSVNRFVGIEGFLAPSRAEYISR